MLRKVVKVPMMSFVYAGLLAASLLALPEVSTWAEDQHTHVYQECICSCGDLEYLDEDDQTVILSDSRLSDLGLYGTDVVIPSEVVLDGTSYTVVGIGAAAFQNHTEVETVTLPDTITTLCDFCFNGCTNLRTIALPEGVMTIGTAAFQLCSSLETIDLPDNLQTLGNFAYNHCPAVQNTEVVLPDGLSQIGLGAEGVTHLFYDVGTDAQFSRFVVSDAPESFSVIDDCLYTKDGSVLLAIPRGKVFSDGVYEMPDSVTRLAELSFSRNPSVHTVVLSDNLCVSDLLTDLQMRAFNNRTNELNGAVYGYAGVTRYETKSSNRYHTAMDGVLYTKHMNWITAVPLQYAGVLDVPEGVTVWPSGVLWPDVSYFEGQALDQITEIRIPASLWVMQDTQLAAINQLVDLYGTVVTVDEQNQAFAVSLDGHLEYLL